MLLTLMGNLNMFGGNVPPPIPDDSGSGFSSGHRKDRDDEKRNEERKRINEILNDDEIILMALKTWVNNFN